MSDKLTKELVSSVYGEFTWGFGCTFFIETSLGNFEWKDPDYSGDNSLRVFPGDYAQWLRMSNIPFGRDKGTHLICNYCGTDFTFIGE